MQIDIPLVSRSEGVSMTLHDLLSQYLRANPASPRYQESLRRTVRRGASYSLTYVSQLAPATVNDFLAGLPQGPTTKHNIRRELLTLWRWGYEEGYTDVQPTRVRRVQPSRRPPEAWSVETMLRMLDAAERDCTVINRRRKHVERRHVLPCWITVGFETGLRLTDLMALNADNFRNGCCVLTAHKTGKPTVRRVGKYAQEKVGQLLAMSPDGTLFRWVMTRRTAIKMWATFLRDLGLPGSSKWLRRSGATEIEREHPGMATYWLDHSAPHLARQHYIDFSLLSPPIGPKPLRE